MELIKLPIYLGLIVVKELEKKNISPRKVNVGAMKGFYSLEFTLEELGMIEELEIVNPTTKCLDGIEYLVNLRKLKITSPLGSHYSKEVISISDRDIINIAKLKKLKVLILDNQSEINWVILDQLTELEELSITRNTSLQEIIGLNGLHNLKSFTEYGNKDLYEVDGLNEMIQQNDLDDIQIDLFRFSDILASHSSLVGMVNCDFIENISGSNNLINYSYYQVLLFHQKCLEIAKQAQSFSMDKRKQIMFVEKYLAEHVTYDYEALKTDKRIHIENGVTRGKKKGTNSAYNGIMYGSAVCEGYSKSMQYILKLLGIKSRSVSCISGANRISVNSQHSNMVSLPDDGYHSILRIEYNNEIYYCDPCWDSCRWHRGDTSLPYCLLTKEEMKNDHTLSFEEDDVIYSIIFPRRLVASCLDEMNNVSMEDENTRKR